MPLLDKLFNRNKTKPQGEVYCERCGWEGSVSEIFKTQVMNTDSSKYVIEVCPQCMRNGRLVRRAK